MNGDFETNADQWVQWPGYAVTEAQLRPFNDNGNNRTGVAFMQGTAKIEQEVSGLTVGEEYVLSLDFNARNCCGGGIPAPQLDLTWNLSKISPGPQFTDGQVTPAGGNNAWYSLRDDVCGRATASSVAHSRIANGDSTLLVDNVSIRTKTAGLPGDFNSNGELDAGDLDLQAAQMVLNPVPPPAGYDLNNDNKVNYDDRLVWLHDLKKTWVGDSDLNGLFDSADFVLAFQAGKYEVIGATATCGSKATGTATSCSPAPTLSRPLPTAVTRPVRGLLP